MEQLLVNYAIWLIVLVAIIMAVRAVPLIPEFFKQIIFICAGAIVLIGAIKLLLALT